MPTPTLSRRTLATLVAASTLATRAQAQSAPATAQLQSVAKFDMQVTGVAVAPSGRTFVNFPRWEQDVPVSVAELMPDGSLKPYPDAAWNSWRNADPTMNDPKTNAEKWVCVQSVTVDPQGFLWVVDPAAPGNEFNLKGGPKLVKFDLKTNRLVRNYPFDDKACPQGSYLNDVRVSPDGKYAYLTDSGVIGALLVLDTATGKVTRHLAGDKSTQVDKSVTVTVGGKPLKRPDGRGPAFAADGIALSTDGNTLYWQVLDGDTLYSISTAALRASPSPTTSVKTLGKTNVADGYWMARDGRLYITSPDDSAVKRRNPDGSFTIVAQDPALVWPDSMAEGPDGTLYVTASHIPDMMQFTAHPRQGQTQLFKFTPPK